MPLASLHGLQTAPAPKAENALKKIFILLRAQTGHDFSLYKPEHHPRRIERRMAVHQIETLDEYVSICSKHRRKWKRSFAIC